MEVKILNDINLTLVIVEGAVSSSRFKEFFESQGPRPTNDVLYLYRNITSNLSVDEAREFAKEIRNEGGHSERRTCYVIDSKLDFGIQRAFVTYANQENANQRYVCSEISEAAKWLGIDANYLTGEIEEMIQAGD